MPRALAAPPKVLTVVCGAQVRRALTSDASGIDTQRKCVAVSQWLCLAVRATVGARACSYHLKTTLMISSRDGHTRAIAVLLAYGASPDLVDTVPQTAVA